jgi:hypothetical protein
VDNEKSIIIGVLVFGILTVGVVFAYSMVIPNKLDYTPEELERLYLKYNITENDIKFARGELPHYLEGTILDGKTRVIATDTGKPPEGLKEGVDYDMVISIDEVIAIEEKARKRYIEKFGVDPANPKLDSVNGQLIPKKEVERLVKSGKIKLNDARDAQPLTGILGGSTTGPHAINGRIDVHIFKAKDRVHMPSEPISSDTNAALARFDYNFGVSMNKIWYFGYWDAGDIAPSTSSLEALADLEQDEGWVRTQDNDIVLGWAHDLDHNGIAYGDGFFAVNSDTAVGNPDWPHDSIVQHETSHLFNADDRGTWWWEHPECIMNYEWAYLGTDIWDTEDWNIVNENVWGS